MGKKGTHIDRVFALILGTLVAGGSLVFASAAFGLLARGNSNIPSVVFSHVVLGIGGGLILLFIAASIDYKLLRKIAPWFFGLAVLATALVFVPHIGMSHGGGRRWISILHITLQPSEILKLATLILAAAYCAMIRDKIQTLKHGLGGYLAIIALPTLLLVAQPDLGTLGVIVLSTLALFWVSGLKFQHVILLFVVGALALGGLFLLRPYVRDRVMTFIHPAQQGQGTGYQIRQSLIAIGSGGLLGRGLGQGIQKFTYLPEPMGDSIFAVAGEEFGFAGSVLIVLLFTACGLRGLRIASLARDAFGKALAVGISAYLLAEAFINIASMLSLAPLTGIPLTFVSQGGSAMLISLASAGVLLSISRSAKVA